jgi:MFS-type transporter involved in bile tolerance (Atg22 family)
MTLCRVGWRHESVLDGLRQKSIMSGTQAHPRWTFSIFMIILATSIPFVVTGVDPLLLSLNLPAIRQDLGIPYDLVGFTGSVATLVMAAAVLGVGNLGDLYGHKRLLIYGLIGNIFFEVLTAFSPNYQFLIVMRFLDGLALTALLGLSLALLTASMPALDLALFLMPAFVVAILSDAVLNFYSGGFGVLLGQFGTSVLGLSEAAIGLIAIPSALSAAVVSILEGRLIPKYTNRAVMIVGLFIQRPSPAP